MDILIATPGRLLDLIGQGEVKLEKPDAFRGRSRPECSTWDSSPTSGGCCPCFRQSGKRFSFQRPCPGYRRPFGLHPARSGTGRGTPVSSTVDTVDQRIYFVENPKKGLLISLLKQESDKSVLVFSRTKHGADSISRILKKAGIRSEAIHGNKSQGQRQRALGDFKSGKIQVMVATDIAARGIDINELNMVINYDLPDVAETYVHRIGRTGRAGRSGTASFILFQR